MLERVGKARFLERVLCWRDRLGGPGVRGH